MSTQEVRQRIEEIDSMLSDLEMTIADLDVESPQSLDNDFSAPLVIAESLVKLCNDLMVEADK